MPFTIQRTLAAAVALAIAAAPGARAADIKVDVTGTNIKRIEGETGQPLQVITKEDIQSSGATTAMELLDRIAINSPVGNYTLANAFGDSARIGFSGASLRGLGYKYTVVLLNGRRIANYAHDGTAADLNAIPLGAIERVEVLKDGASAIYGTDAIGGVINFITRNDYKGIEASAYYGDTFDGGAREKSVTATLGFGDLSKDRYNAFVSMQWMKQEPLFGRDRPFSQSSYIPSEGLDSTSGRSFPGNVAVPGVGNRNPLYPNCAPSLAADPDVYPGQCRFDPNPFLGSLPEVEKFNMVARGTFQLTPDHQAFIEGLYAKNEYRYVLQPVPIGQGVLFPAAGPDAPGFFLPPSSPFYPHDFAARFGLDGQPLNIQWRAFDAGLRDSTTTAEQTRIVAGFRGVVKGWDYEAAYSYNQSKDKDHLNGGYLSQAALLPIINSGNVNPFGPNTPEIVSQLRARRSRPTRARRSRRSKRSTARSATRSTTCRPGRSRSRSAASTARKSTTRCRPTSCRRATSSATARRARPSPAIARCTRSSPRRSCRSSRTSSSTRRCGTTTTATSARRPTRSCRCAGSRPSNSSRARRTARASARRRSPSCSRRR
jgi:iron complex outermembrane receptor protein